MTEETARLVAQSVVVIVGVALIVGALVGWWAHCWWEDRQWRRADLDSTQRWSRATNTLSRYLR